MLTFEWPWLKFKIISFFSSEIEKMTNLVRFLLHQISTSRHFSDLHFVLQHRLVLDAKFTNKRVGGYLHELCFVQLLLLLLLLLLCRLVGLSLLTEVKTSRMKSLRMRSVLRRRWRRNRPVRVAFRHHICRILTQLRVKTRILWVGAIFSSAIKQR